MKSYLVFTQDRETGEVEIESKLVPRETMMLEHIRHMLVEHITTLIDPECKKITFKL